MSIRQEVSAIFNYAIPKGGYRKEFRQLEKEGRISNKQIIEIIVLLLEKEEKREENG